jgi:hypothetical protein
MVSIFHGFYFVQTIHEPQNEKRWHFAKMQKNQKKYIKECFNVLRFKFTIIETHVGCDKWMQFMTS